LLMLVVVAVMTAVTLDPKVVNAIVSGTDDTTGQFNLVGRVGSIGFVEGYVEGCSGSLIADNLFLSAGHCLGTHSLLGASRTGVSFDPEVANEAYPAPFPGTEGSVYTLPGTTITHPFFLDSVNRNCLFNSAGISINHCVAHNNNRNDLTVVVLDTPIEGVQTADLLPEGYLETLTTTQLDALEFTLSGYGHDSSAGNNANPPSVSGTDGVRRYGVVDYQSKTQALITLNGDNSDDGHSCGGDSGGPVFIGDANSASQDRVQIAIINTGNQFCNYIEKDIRLDTKEQICFLNIVKAGVLAERTDYSDSCVFYWLNGILHQCPFYQEVEACVNA